MGFRFRRSKKILPGVRLNLNKKSIGLTFGGKGFKYTINSSGRRTASVGIPGTGLSYSTSSGGKKGTTKRTPKSAKPSKSTAKESAAIEGQFTQVHESTNAMQPVDNGVSPPQDGSAGPKGKGPGCSGCLIWISSIFLLFSGLVYFPSATSLLCLTAGLLILPIRRWIEFMEGFIPVPGKMRAAIAIVFFVLSVMFYANPDTAPASAPASATATASATPLPTISATAEPTETPAATSTPHPTATASPTPTAPPQQRQSQPPHRNQQRHRCPRLPQQRLLHRKLRQSRRQRLRPTLKWSGFRRMAGRSITEDPGAAK